MDNLPFDASGLNNAVIDNFKAIYSSVKNRFNLQFTGHINFHLEDFEAFRNCLEINQRASYVIKHERSDSYLLLLETKHTGGIGKKHIAGEYYLYHTWALAYLKKDFGRIIIRPETLRDKIIELIHPLELDFDDDKAFSDTFYVIVSDVQKAKLCMDRKFRNAVMDIRDNDFIIEIVNHTLLIGSHHPMQPEKAIEIADFVNQLAGFC